MESSLSEKTPLVNVQNVSQNAGEDASIVDVSQNGTSNIKKETDNVNTKAGDKSGFKFFASLSGRRKYTLILIALAAFLASVAFSLLGPFYPTEAAKKGMNISIVGLVFGIFHVVIFLTAPFYGNYLIKLGPKFVFLSGIFVAGVCNILFGTLEYCPNGTPFIVMSILIRAVEAVGVSAYMTSSFAIVASEFKENVGFTYGILETATGVGYMLGPTIGGALYALGGFGVPFYFAGIAILLNAITVYKFLPPVENIPPRKNGSVLTLLRNPMMFVQLGSVVVGMTGISAWDSTFAKRVEPFNLSVLLVGIIFGVVSLMYSITSSIWGYISDTKDIQAPLIIVGHFVYGIGFLLIGPSILLPFLPSSIVTIILGLACIGVSFGCTLIPTMKCMIIGAIDTGFDNNIDTYALVSGLFNSMQTFGGFIGPVGIGYLVQEFDFPVAYTVVGVASLFMMIVSLVFFTSRRLHRKGMYKCIDNAEPSDHMMSTTREDLVMSYNATNRIPFSRSCSVSASFDRSYQD